MARTGPGWQTSAWDPRDLEWRVKDTLRKVEEQGRDPASFETHLYHNINVNEDREAALEESRRFLDMYYVPMKFSRTFVDQWVATGTPRQCAERIQRLWDIGFKEVTLRITSWDQRGQFRRLVEDVLPLLGARASDRRASASTERSPHM